MKALILQVVFLVLTYLVVSHFGFGLLAAIGVFFVINVIAAMFRGVGRLFNP